MINSEPTVSVTSFDGHCVRLDFETREEADAFAEHFIATRTESPVYASGIKRTAGELGLAPKKCICDPMDLAALGHMLNCPVYSQHPASGNAGDPLPTVLYCIDEALKGPTLESLVNDVRNLRVFVRQELATRTDSQSTDAAKLIHRIDVVDRRAAEDIFVVGDLIGLLRDCRAAIAALTPSQSDNGEA